MAVQFNGDFAAPFIHDYELEAMQPQVKAAHELLHSKSGLGNDFLGWVDLPVNYDKAEFARIKQAAQKIISIMSMKTICP